MLAAGAQEFTIGMSKLMRGTTNQKLTLLFETLSGGKGEIDLVDLVKFVRATTSEIQEDAEFATEVRCHCRCAVGSRLLALCPRADRSASWRLLSQWRACPCT